MAPTGRTRLSSSGIVNDTGEPDVVASGARQHAGEQLPDEPRPLALVLCGTRQPEHWGDAGKTPGGRLDFFDLKGVVASLVEALHLPEVTYRPATVPYLHPGKSAELVVGKQVVGHFGEMHPRVAETLGFGGKAILAGEFELRLADDEARAVVETQVGRRLLVVLDRRVGIVGGDAPVAGLLREVGGMRQDRGIVHHDMARRIRPDNQRLAIERNGRFRLLRGADDQKFRHREERFCDARKENN